MIKVVDRLEAVPNRIKPPEYDRQSVRGYGDTLLGHTRGRLIAGRAELVTREGEVSLPISPDMLDAFSRMMRSSRPNTVIITVETDYTVTKLDSVLAVERRDGAAAALQYAKALLGAQ